MDLEESIVYGCCLPNFYGSDRISLLSYSYSTMTSKISLIDLCEKTPVRGFVPAKVGFWVGLRIFSYVPTPTKLTNAISKTQLSGPKKGVFSPKIPRKCPFFVFGVF